MENNFLFKLEELGEKKKRQRKAASKYGAHMQRIPMKKLIKGKTIKHLDADILEQQIYTSLPEFMKELNNFYRKDSSKLFEDREELADFLARPKVSKAIYNIIADHGNRIKGIDILYYAISDIQLNTDALKEDEKVLQRYLKIFRNRDGEFIKKTAKILDIEKIDSLLIYLMSTTFRNAPRKIVRDRVYKVLNLLYESCEGKDVSEKDMKKVISQLFRDRDSFILYALLEKPCNRNEKAEGYETLTAVVLEMMNKMDRDDLKDLLKTYAKCRRNNVHVKRRLNLTNVDEDDYKNIAKTVDKLISNGMDKEYFM